MRIRWTPAAAADLQGISDYLSEHHPRYRSATMRKLYRTVSDLKKWPLRGRPGSEAGTRELLFPPTPYVAVYRIMDQAIEIMRIYHAAQDRFESSFN
jgi:addiction module RelE/StbE family toxin